MDDYIIAIIVFLLGLITTAWLIFYIISSSLRLKNSDPFEGEDEILEK